MKRDIVLIAHNLRSAHNVGSLLRTADGLGISEVHLTGYTPYPQTPDDKRLPHEALKVHRSIQKTALGAEVSQKWGHVEDIFALMSDLSANGYTIAALEQQTGSTRLPDWQAPSKTALIVGREVEGIEQTILDTVDEVIEIPMTGQKESFNVAQAAAMALYHLCFTN